MLKVLFVVLAFTTAWLFTAIKRNRSKVRDLRNKVAQFEKIVIELQVIITELKLKEYGKDEKGEETKKG